LFEGAFTASLNSNRSYSIVACVFVAAEMCLPSRCVAMNVYSDFTIPVFGRHVTIRKLIQIERYILTTYHMIYDLFDNAVNSSGYIGLSVKVVTG
jgi:hypothetical protein